MSAKNQLKCLVTTAKGTHKEPVASATDVETDLRWKSFSIQLHGSLASSSYKVHRDKIVINCGSAGHIVVEPKLEEPPNEDENYEFVVVEVPPAQSEDADKKNKVGSVTKETVKKRKVIPTIQGSTSERKMTKDSERSTVKKKGNVWRQTEARTGMKGRTAIGGEVGKKCDQGKRTMEEEKGENQFGSGQEQNDDIVQRKAKRQKVIPVISLLSSDEDERTVTKNAQKKVEGKNPRNKGTFLVRRVDRNCAVTFSF